jgi:hypothetical protein
MLRKARAGRLLQRIAPGLVSGVAVLVLLVGGAAPATAAGQVWYKQGEASADQYFTSVQATLTGGATFASGQQIMNHIRTLKGTTTYQIFESYGSSAQITHATVTAATGGRSSCNFSLPLGGAATPYLQCRYFTP